MARRSATRVVQHLVPVMALATAVASAAGGTQLVRRASTPLANAYQDRREFPQELSIDALSAEEIGHIKQGILSYLQKNPLGREDGIEGCMQWVFLRHRADEPWSAVGYSLPWLRVGAVKINGFLRRANLSYRIEPMLKAQGWLRGTVSVPGTRPGSGAIFVTPLANRSDFTQWLSELENDRQSSLRLLEGNSDSTQWALRIAPVSNLKVALPRFRCTLLAAECRQYVSVVDDDASWMPSGVNRSPPKEAVEPIPLASGLRMELAVEDMCPFSRQGMVEGPVNTRAHPVERGIKAFGIPGNASLKTALSGK